MKQIPRSSKTGKFVTKSYAKRHKSTTQVETVGMPDYIEAKRVVRLIKWLLGYYDFPERQEGQGAYYWRSALRKRAAALGIHISDIPGKNKRRKK